MSVPNFPKDKIDFKEQGFRVVCSFNGTSLSVRVSRESALWTAELGASQIKAIGIIVLESPEDLFLLFGKIASNQANEPSISFDQNARLTTEKFLF